MRRGCTLLLTDVAAQLWLSETAKQPVVTSRIGRIDTLPTIAIRVRSEMDDRRQIRRLTIVQIVRFVRQFRLRESWQF